MCGIVGSVGIFLNDSILRTLQHRGPDGHCLEQILCGGENVSLGHTRLAILDLSPAGRQPMSSSDGRWCVSFNGEIYNHLELRRMFSSEVHWRGHSDTETLVEAIAANGLDEVLLQLNGMYAFAALDTREAKLYLMRDPFGIKPLYYWHDGMRFAFASEIGALRALGLVEGLNEAGLNQFLALRYVPSPATLWRGVRRLPPGHAACFDIESGALQISPFIAPTQESFDGSLEEAVEAYRLQLSATVKRQLLSDVPVGVLLSGGVDSALVAAMAKESGFALPCFTVGFGSEHPECEIAYAKETAKVLGLPFHAIKVTADDLRSALPQIARAVEEPLGTTSVMPMWYLVQRARQDVTVVLTGQGSDEPWGGYFRYQVELLRNKFPWPGAWKLVRKALARWRSKPETLARGLESLAARDVVKQILAASVLFPANERRDLVGYWDDSDVELSLSNWLCWLADKPDLSGAERMMRVDSRMNLADDLLLYGDKISMAVSLEARVPMLDVELVRFIESLPIEYRVRWRQGKVVHKCMAERYLPSEIVHRPKMGFQVPFGDWSKNKWRGYIESLLLDGLNGLLDRSVVECFWREHLAGKPDRSRQIFALCMLALWRMEHVK